MHPWLCNILTISTLLLSLPAAAGATTLSITLNPTSVTGGSEVTVSVHLIAKGLLPGTVRRSEPEITLSIDKQGAASFTTGGVLRVPMGDRTTTSVAVRTYVVTQSVTVTISATYAGVVKTATLQVNPGSPYPTGILFAPNPVRAGDPVTATVLLNDPAPSGGLTIPLSGSAGGATIPSSITVPAGEKTASFTVNTAPQGGTVRIFPPGVELTVKPPCPAGILLTPNPVIGGRSVSGTVIFHRPFPSNYSGHILLSITPNSYATVPYSIQIPGGAMSATFTVTTKNPLVASISLQVFAACDSRVSSTLVLTVY